MYRTINSLLFLILLTIGLGFTTAVHAKVTYQYQVRVNPDQLEKPLSIEAKFEGLEKQRTLFTVARSIGTVVDLKIVRNLKAFDDKGRPLEVRQDSEGYWNLDTATKSIKLQYDIDLGHPKAQPVSIQQPGGLAIPNVFENGITFRPVFCFIHPKDLHSDPEIQVQFEKPENWEIASSWSNLSQIQDFSHLLGSYFLVYRKSGFVKTSDEAVELYWAKKPETDKFLTLEHLSKIQSIFKSQLGFFKTDKKDGKYIGIITPASAGGGEAGFRGLLVTYNLSSVNAEEIFSNRGGSIVHTLSHEFFHFWESEAAYQKDDSPPDLLKNKPEEGGDFRWFTEGFTDYFSYFFLVKSGLLSVSEFTDVLEKKAEATSFSNPKERISLLQSSRNFFKNHESSAISYELGALVALKLDYLLKSETDGKKNLLGFLSFFLNDLKVKKATNNYEFFKKALNDYHPGVVSRIVPYIEDVKNVELSQILEAFGGKNIPTFRYMLGSATTNQEAPICLLNPPERILKFGLREGDCIVKIGSKIVTSRKQLYEYQDRPVPITVERKGRKIDFTVNLIKKFDSHWSFGVSSKLKLIDP